MNYQEQNFHTRLPPKKSNPTPPVGDSAQVVFPISFGGPVSGQKLIARTPSGYEYADYTTIDHTKVVIGMTREGSSTGDVNILAEGFYEDPSMSLTVGPLWLDSSGNFTSTAPTTGFLMQVGKVIEPTKLYIHLLPGIVRA